MNRQMKTELILPWLNRVTEITASIAEIVQQMDAGYLDERAFDHDRVMQFCCAMIDAHRLLWIAAEQLRAAGRE